ncbi:phage integrase (plasmid) [Zymomonas mobilis subsp. mobilis ATCC 31822]|nr:phage integrase [Zymomonas mobilis subsp. mobilis]AVZ28700.1 phage integrase [Zymomonas mobilis subsp. mobilis]
MPEQTFRLVTLIAAYSGMRLGEIYVLRKEDLQSVDDIPCFLIRPHTETGWAPKTDAGTRIVPVHSKLIEAGVLRPRMSWLGDFKAGCQRRSARAGFFFTKNSYRIACEITFHSFRHTVSTQLRNAHTDIR